MSDADYELGDEFVYHAFQIGRPTRTAEVAAGDGTTTIEEGTLTAELVHKEDLHETRESDGWIAYYVSPDGGVGFGIEEGNPGGVAVPYDLVDIIEFPEPMTEKEAAEWLDDADLLQYRDESIESDTTADDLLGAVR